MNRKEANLRYNRTEKARIKRRQYQKTERKTERYKKYQKKYRKMKRYKKYQKEYAREYGQTIRGCLIRRFINMKRRCNNPTDPAYKNYGGRGIKNKFQSSNEFVNYVISKLKIDPRGLDIDRINNDGNYEKGNIRFVVHKENCHNKKRAKKCR